MKPYELNDKSLHWRLASVYGPVTDSEVYYGRVDSCAYNRAVFWGFLVTVAIITAGTLFGYGLMDWLFWAYTYLFVGNVDASVAASVFVAILSVCGGIGLLGAAIIGYEKYKEKKLAAEGYKRKEPGYLKVAYQSWKDKHCSIVKIAGQQTYAQYVAEQLEEQEAERALWRDSTTNEVVAEAPCEP